MRHEATQRSMRREQVVEAVQLRLAPAGGPPAGVGPGGSSSVVAVAGAATPGTSAGQSHKCVASDGTEYTPVCCLPFQAVLAAHLGGAEGSSE